MHTQTCKDLYLYLCIICMGIGQQVDHLRILLDPELLVLLFNHHWPVGEHLLTHLSDGAPKLGMLATLDAKDCYDWTALLLVSAGKLATYGITLTGNQSMPAFSS